MPFIESVPSTEYMIAVELGRPFSLSEPNDNPRPIAGPRKNLSARLLSIGVWGWPTKTRSPSRWSRDRIVNIISALVGLGSPGGSTT